MNVPYRLPMFFFMSGFFFRVKPFPIFIEKRVNSLLVPFFSFIILSYLCQIFNVELLSRVFPSLEFPLQVNYNQNLLAGKELFCFQWSEGVQNPITPLNGPLWFLMALFLVQMVYYVFIKYSVSNRTKVILAGLSVGVVEIAIRLADKYHLGGFLYFSYGLSFYKYYVAGNVFGPWLVKYLKQIGWGMKILIVLLCVGLLFWNGKAPYSLVLGVHSLSFTVIMFVLMQEIYRFSRIKWMEFFGIHSLELLCSHILILNLMYAVMNAWGIATNLVVVIGMYCLLLGIERYVILFLDKWMPYIVNKKSLFASGR